MLSDFGHWLLLSEGGLWVGAALMWAGILVLAGYLVWKYGDVRMGADPEIPRVVEPLRRALPAAPIAPNYVRFVEAVDAMAAEIDDLADTVEFKVIPVEVVEEPEETPLFWTIRRPAPYDLETFTDSITRAQIERAKKAAST